MKPVVFLEVDQGALELMKQWGVCLQFAQVNRLHIVVYAATPEDAASVIEAGNAVCAVAAVPAWRGGEPECLAGRIQYVRGPLPKRASVGQLEIATALLVKAQDSGDMAKVAEALAVLRPDLPRRAGPRADGRTYPINPADADPSKPIPGDAA